MDKKSSCPVTLIKSGKHVTKVTYLLPTEKRSLLLYINITYCNSIIYIKFSNFLIYKNYCK